MITTRQAEKVLKQITGQTVKLKRAPKHAGTAVFLDSEGYQRIAALWNYHGELFAWRLPDRDVRVSDIEVCDVNEKTKRTLASK